MLHPRMRAALALACLLALAAPGVAASSNARAERAALATEQYYSSYTAAPQDAGATQRALAAERYYSSYGEAQPLAKPSSGTSVAQAPQRATSAALIAVLLLAAAGTGVLAGRLSTRRWTPRLRARRAHEPSTP